VDVEPFYNHPRRRTMPTVGASSFCRCPTSEAFTARRRSRSWRKPSAVGDLGDLRDVVGDVAQPAVQRDRLGVVLGLVHEPVDALGDARLGAEDLGLDLVEVVAQLPGHGLVVVDHAVEHRVYARARPEAQQVGSPRGGRGRRPGQAPPRAGPPRRIRPEEHVQLPDLHVLLLVDVSHRAEDHENNVAVLLDLRPLMGVDGVSTASAGREKSRAR